MNRKKWILDVVLILAANTMYALGVVMFLLPNGFIMGGTTGLALAAQNYFGIPITSFVSVFNIGMFLVGALILGKKFAMTTILSTFYYPFILGALQNPPASPDGRRYDFRRSIGRLDDRNRHRNRDPLRSFYRRNGYSASVNPPLFWNSGFRYHVWI